MELLTKYVTMPIYMFLILIALEVFMAIRIYKKQKEVDIVRNNNILMSNSFLNSALAYQQIFIELQNDLDDKNYAIALLKINEILETIVIEEYYEYDE